MDVSVIVPTYNRCADVQQTLLSLAAQSYSPARYEVVVADDGSTDGTQEMVQALQVPYCLRYAWQPNRGRCAARNLGLAQASGELILFLDGDMVAEPQLVAEHARSHAERDRVLVRGSIPIWPPLLTTCFMKHGLGYWSDSVDLMDREGFLSFSAANTQNMSIKRLHLDEIGHFDETLDVGYAWDDTDLGYRAHKAGLRLFYNPAAIAFHNDWVCMLEQQCQRIWLASKTIPLLFVKYPELRGQIRRYVDKEPIALGQDSLRLVARKLARRVLALPPMLGGLKLLVRGLERCYPSPALLRRCYWLVLGGYALKGYREGSKSMEV